LRRCRGRHRAVRRLSTTVGDIGVVTEASRRTGRLRAEEGVIEAITRLSTAARDDLIEAVVIGQACRVDARLRVWGAVHWELTAVWDRGGGTYAGVTDHVRAGVSIIDAVTDALAAERDRGVSAGAIGLTDGRCAGVIVVVAVSHVIAAARGVHRVADEPIADRLSARVAIVWAVRWIEAAARLKVRDAGVVHTEDRDTGIAAEVAVAMCLTTIRDFLFDAVASLAAQVGAGIAIVRAVGH
jgi:hypothetical protein